MRSIPTTIEGVEEILVVVIDDGSSDNTATLAKSLGAYDVIRHRRTRGLAEAFRSGVDYALTHGADILVNTDGDNQYPSKYIPRLVGPILEGRADIVIGDRQTKKIPHFSRGKKLLQLVGSRVVSKAARTKIPDVASGFRAYSRSALLHINVITKFSYTMETIIQASHKGLAIESVRIKTNPKTRESRLFKSAPEHVLKSAAAIIRAFVMYRPYVFFGSLGLLTGLGALIPFLRYFVLVISGSPGEHIQSLLVGVSLLTASLLSLTLGVVADLIRINRQLIEDGLAIQKTHQTKQSLSEIDRV